MRRDVFGICLFKDMFCEYLYLIFIYVRVYEIELEMYDEMCVLFVFF